MNKSFNVKVKTPLGMTETKKAGEGPSQGNVDAALISANSIGNGVEDILTDKEREIRYDNDLVLSALSYMDDIGRLSDSREGTQYANDKLEEMMNRKGLEFKTDKE